MGRGPRRSSNGKGLLRLHRRCRSTDHRLGLERSVFGVLEKGTARFRLTLHEMRHRKAAVALMEQNLFDDTQSIQVGDRAVYWDRGLFSRGILFRKKGLVCELILEKEPNKDTLLRLAQGMEKLIP